MEQEARIVCNPEILCGKPIIRGTRISVELLLERLGHGATFSEILEAYPHITEEDIRAALRFAAEALRSDFVYPLAG